MIAIDIKAYFAIVAHSILLETLFISISYLRLDLSISISECLAETLTLLLSGLKNSPLFV